MNDTITYSDIYLDNGATTSVDHRVLATMLPYLETSYGNASSLHSFGRIARSAIEESRAIIADGLGALKEEIYFTSGGTEANNMALKGIAYANKNRGNHFIVSSIEHDCILNTCNWLEKHGFIVTYLPVDSTGLVDVDAVNRSITKNTVAVSVMHANNEIGTIEPIAAIGSICRDRAVYFHTDACQTYGKIPLDVNFNNLDLVTISAHKIYGPKGVGALYVRNGTLIDPLLHGGGQEKGMRSGTENVAGIIGFAKAVSLCLEERGREIERLSILRDKIINALAEQIPYLYLNGHPTQRLFNNVNFGIHGLEGEAIKVLLELDHQGFAVSTGSACSSNESQNKPSHVLLAIGLNQIEARGALRIVLGRYTTKKHVDDFLSTFTKILQKLNYLSTYTLT